MSSPDSGGTKAERKPLLSLEQIVELEELRGRGLSVARIARRFGVSKGCIQHNMTKLGLPMSPAHSGRAPQNYRRRGNGHRAGGTVRWFSPEEDRTILALSQEEGLGPVAIGKRLGRSHSSVADRLATLARHEAIRDDEAGL